MVLDQSAELDAVFHALADPTRRAMLRRLADGDSNLAALAAPFAMSFPAASKHVRVLEAAGLVLRRVQGREHVVSLQAQRLADAKEWFAFYEQYWTDRFNALDAMFRAEKAKKP
jgi:DNA-binding transcriptional ArsR family regulator